MTKKSKIFIDITPMVQDKLSGVGHLTKNIVESLLGDDLFLSKYEVIIFSDKKIKRLSGKTKGVAKVVSLPVSIRFIRLLNNYSLLPKIDRFLGKGIYLFFDFYNFPLTKKSKSLTWVHDLSYLRHPESVSEKLRTKLKKGIPKWMKRSTKVIAVSEFTKSEILRNYSIEEEKIEVIYAGVDSSFYKKIPVKVSEQILKKYSLPENSILHVGNIEPRKNIQALLEAFTKLSKEIREKHSLVLIGGDGWNNKSINYQINQLKKLGFNISKPSVYISDKDLVAVISSASLLVAPSVYEGFGITPLEAIACETPVIVSRIPITDELFSKKVTKFDPYNIDELKKAIIRNLMDDVKVDKKLRKTVIKKYSWKNSANKLHKTIDQMLPS